MNPLIRKEVRLILPACIGTLVAAIAPMIFIPGASDLGPTFAIWCLAFGATVIGLSSLGQEVNCRTWLMFFSQPKSRHALWWTKIGVTAGGMLFVLASVACIWRFHPQLQTNPLDIEDNPFWSGPFGEKFRIGGLLMSLALSGGLWTVLVFRKPVIAFWVTVFVPGTISAAIAITVENASHRLFEAVLLTYAIASFIWAYWLFLRAQDVAWTGGTLALPENPAAMRFKTKYRNHWLPLFRKELQFQNVTLFLTVGLVALSIAAMIYASSVNQEHNNKVEVIQAGLVILWCGAIPGVIGCLSVSEERRLGTLEGALCLPVSKKIQFTIKLAVVLLLGIILGVLVPFALFQVGRFFGFKAFNLENLAMGFFTASLTASICFYASTLARNPIEAFCFAIGVPTVVFGGFNIFVTRTVLGTDFYFLRYWAGPAEAAMLLWLAYRNFTTLQTGSRLVWANLWRFSIVYFFVTSTDLAVSNRLWEYFGRSEPKHHAGRINASGPVKMGTTMDRILVCLPDGRLWAASYTSKSREAVDRNIKIGHGTFISSGNWSSLAVAVQHAAGVKQDGTLWQIDSTRNENSSELLSIQQIGQESDWKNVSAGPGHFVALKNDGTLWGWGQNDYGQIGQRNKLHVTDPVELDRGTQWVEAHAGNDVTYGIKADGTVWRWGHRFNHRENVSRSKGEKLEDSPENREPVLSKFIGTNWISFGTLALRGDGTLWSDHPEHYRGSNRFPGLQPAQPETNGLVQIGTESNWKEISLHSTVRRNGSITLGLWRDGISRYRDWLATDFMGRSGAVLFLAADGTVTAWPAYNWREGPTWMQESKRPLFSLNIFDK